nr:isoform 2 of g-box-binding factor 1 [Quercus suber]
MARSSAAQRGGHCGEISVAMKEQQKGLDRDESLVFQFKYKITDNSDEAKRQRRKQANIESAKRSRKRKQDLMKNLEKEVEVLKNTALESSQVYQELKEKCDKAHFENRIAVIDYVTIPLLAYKTELQLMRVIGCHPVNDPVFISMANNAGLNLSDVRRSLLRAPTYPGKVGMQQGQNQTLPNIGLHGAMPGWDNNQQNKY